MVLERLLTVKEAAKLAGVSERTFWKLLAEGKAPATVRPTPKSVRIRASDFGLWLRMGCPSRDALESEKTAAAAAVTA